MGGTEYADSLLDSGQAIEAVRMRVRLKYSV